MPTPFANLGFETAGSSPGAAQSWVYNFLAQAQILAAIDPTQQRPAEDFERDWSIDDYVFAFDPDDADLIQAQYFVSPGPGHFGENFEDGWSTNQGFSFTLINSALAAYGSTLQTVENFEREWSSNESFAFTWADVSPTDALYNSLFEAFEAFEREWRSNESYSFTMGFSILAAYYYAVYGFEAFEIVQAPRQFTVNPSLNLINAPTHGLSDGDIVKFAPGPDSDLPGGLNPISLWFVISATTNTFQVSTVSGGSAQTIFDSGFGIYYYKNDPAAFWTLIMETI